MVAWLASRPDGASKYVMARPASWPDLAGPASQLASPASQPASPASQPARKIHLGLLKQNFNLLICCALTAFGHVAAAPPRYIRMCAWA